MVKIYIVQKAEHLLSSIIDLFRKTADTELIPDQILRASNFGWGESVVINDQPI